INVLPRFIKFSHDNQVLVNETNERDEQVIKEMDIKELNKGFNYKYKDGDKTMATSLMKLLNNDMFLTQINRYNSFVCNPKPGYNNPRRYNKFQGFRLMPLVDKLIKGEPEKY